MSERKMRGVSILLILAFVFTIQYVAQGAYIVWLRADGEAQIQRCLKIEDNTQKIECLTAYIKHRNYNAMVGVNGYLIFTIIVLGVSVFSICKHRKGVRDVKCER